MGVLAELGKILVAEAARAAGRKLQRFGDSVLRHAEAPSRAFTLEEEEGPLLTPEAEAMVAPVVLEPSSRREAPLEGSIASRKVGGKWAL